VILSHQGVEVSRAGDGVDAAATAAKKASTITLLRTRSPVWW